MIRCGQIIDNDNEICNEISCCFDCEVFGTCENVCSFIKTKVITDPKMCGHAAIDEIAENKKGE